MAGAGAPADDLAGRLGELLGRAVEDRMDAPATAVLMSGGLDSTSVAAVARQRRSHGRLLAGSLVFPGLPSCDERGYMEVLASELALDWRPVDAQKHGFLVDAEAYRPRRATPFHSWDGAFRELLSQLSAAGARVVLTGLGGDDMLGGSPRVYAERLAGGDPRALLDLLSDARRHGSGAGRALYRYLVAPLLPPPAYRMARRLLGRPLPDLLPPWLADDAVRRFGLEDRYRSMLRRARGRTVTDQIAQRAWGLNGYGHSVEWFDHLAIDCGVEVRHPFLDRRILEFVLSTPPRALFRAGSYKALLREAMVGILPDPVRLRSDKTDLTAFVDFSLRERVEVDFQGGRLAPYAEDLGLVDGRRLRAAVERYRRGEADGSLRRIWYALTLERWLSRFSRDASSPMAA